jgi:hypothetical protein
VNEKYNIGEQMNANMFHLIAWSSTEFVNLIHNGTVNSQIQHKMNQCYHEVGTQVNMDDVSGTKLGVGMATCGPSFGHRYVDPSPIARHVVDPDAIEGKEFIELSPHS